MNRRIIYVLVGLAFIFFLTSLIIFLRSQKSAEITKEEEPVATEIGDQAKIPESIKVKLFFFKENSRFMQPVAKEIVFSKIKEEMYDSFINLLLLGQKDYILPIPEGLRLRSLYHIKSKQLLVLDFSEELINNFPSGSRTELEFIYFIVDNICYNFKEIKKVKLLVMGNEYRTIKGHIDIEHPFYPDFTYLRDK